MAKNTVSILDDAFSTGGGGVNFEQRVQAMFLLSLLVDVFCPAMEERSESAFGRNVLAMMLMIWQYLLIEISRKGKCCVK